MKNAILGAVLVLSAVVVGYLLGARGVGSARLIAERVGPPGSYMTQSPEGNVLYFWSFKDGKPVELRSFSLWMDPPAADGSQDRHERLKETVFLLK